MTMRRASGVVARGTARMFNTWTNGELVPHIASVMAVFVLSAAFLKNVWLGKVDGFDYLYFAVAMSASASPSLMFKLIALKFTGVVPSAPEEKV